MLDCRSVRPVTIMDRHKADTLWEGERGKRWWERFLFETRVKEKTGRRALIHKQFRKSTQILTSLTTSVGRVHHMRGVQRMDIVWRECWALLCRVRHLKGIGVTLPRDALELCDQLGMKYRSNRQRKTMIGRMACSMPCLRPARQSFYCSIT